MMSRRSERGVGTEPHAAWLAVAAGALIGVMAVLYYRSPREIEPAQPLPFSHRLHAGDKQIGCYFCHSTAMDSRQAGMPPLQTCMLCHERIITAYPKIVELREHYAGRTPIAWKRVYILPDFVHFTHEAHLLRGVDCGACHGNIQGMDRLAGQEFKMGFCVQCHRDNRVSTDCLVCHH